jgi:glutamyl-tRNA reductase
MLYSTPNALLKVAAWLARVHTPHSGGELVKNSQRGARTMEMGFIGLGGMGEPIARNLIKAGHALRVYNRTRTRAEALLSQGAILAETPAAAASAA